MKEVLLVEFQEDNILFEKTRNGKIYITGIYSTFEEGNRNKRYYPENVLKPEIEKLIETKVKRNALVGELDHPERIGVSLQKASHKIEELTIDGKHVYGRALVIEGTDQGRNLKGLIEAGVLLGISSRATGKTAFDKKRNLYKVEAINLRTWDVVSDPSNYYSHLKSLYENEYGPIEDLKTTDQEKIQEELRSKMEIYTKLTKPFLEIFN